MTKTPVPSEALNSKAERDAQSEYKIPITVVALGIVSLLNDLGGDAVTPLLPAFVATVGGGPEALGLIEVGAMVGSGSILAKKYGSRFHAMSSPNLKRAKMVTMMSAQWHAD